MSFTKNKHLLLYEPRTEGHHLGWLRFIVEDLLGADFRLSIAADLRPDSCNRVEENLAGLLDKVTLFSAYDKSSRRHLDGKAGSVAHCLSISGADNVFLCALDEIASDCWRRATFGSLPPSQLRGHMGGIYHRPRFLAASKWSLDRRLKEPGFRRMLQESWWRQILFVDEFLAAELKAAYPTTPVFFLPDTCPPDYDQNQAAAQKKLNIPVGRKVMLFYGTGARRKGLHLAVEAMRHLPAESPAFLLCAGQQNPTGKTAAYLTDLVLQNRACLLNRYVSLEEEKICFAAADAVLLPYLNHFGTSGVLSRAMSAAKPVIVSDEQLLGRLTREHQLGLVFPSGNASALAQRMQEIVHLSKADEARFESAARHHANVHSRVAFRTALLQSLSAG